MSGGISYGPYPATGVCSLTRNHALLWLVVLLLGSGLRAETADRSLNPPSDANETDGSAGTALDQIETHIIRSIDFQGNRKYSNKVLRQRLGI